MQNNDLTRIRPLTRDEIRGIDATVIAEFGLPGIVLMENAGRGATEVLMQLGIAGRVVILAGKGNNGGDGFVIARHLELMGIRPTIVLVAKPDHMRGDAKTNLDVAIASEVEIIHFEGSNGLTTLLEHADWVIDCLLGTGIKSAPRSPIDDVIQMVNACDARVVAIDVPSGLDCDTGECAGECISAADTITFVSEKVGMTAATAHSHVGKIHVVGIGVPRKLLERFR